MRPQRIVSCILWFLLIGLSLHIVYFFLIPLIFNEDKSTNNYISINRDVKEWKVDQTPLRLTLLDKLKSQFIEVRKFYPDIIGNPTPLRRRYVKKFAKNQTSKYNLYNQNVSLLNSSELLRLMYTINQEQEVLNKDVFPYPEYVIVIQIHNRLEYLTILINCLLNIKDIHKALIVFSHDMYVPVFNRLIRSIKFAPVIQIFFPFNQQVFSSQFPGPSTKDCDVKLKKDSLMTKGCFNIEWSDSYGNYRNYKYTQTKHHWTWKTNFVFEHLQYLKNYQNYIIFIEEDHFLTEDFLHVLKLMIDLRRKKHDSVSILALGTYEKSYHYEDTAKVQVGDWVSSFHNMGMTFDKALWSKLMKCSKEFCEFDDYNWDWSMHHISRRCLPSPLQVMLLKGAPRIFHIGECGIHHKKKECNPYVILYKIQQMIAKNIHTLYPDSVTFIGPTTFRSRDIKPNGGWSDLRDKRLCSAILSNNRSLDNITSVYPLDSKNSLIESILL